VIGSQSLPTRVQLGQVEVVQKQLATAVGQVNNVITTALPALYKQLNENGIVLSAGERMSIGTLTLKVGGLTETVVVEAQGTQVVVTVEDNGAGLPEADRERVFQRFVRATYDGTGCGLGLAIAREIVTRHAGTVVLEAAHPSGLRAVIRLPRCGG